MGTDATGIDYKAPHIQALTGLKSKDPGKRVTETIRLALVAELDVRTTVHKVLLGEDDLATMHDELNAIGVSGWTLQQFNPVEVIDDDLPKLPTYSDRELVAMAKRLRPKVRVRGLHGHLIL